MGLKRAATKASREALRGRRFRKVAVKVAPDLIDFGIDVIFNAYNNRNRGETPGRVSLKGSRLKQEGAVSGDVADILRKMDPVDSLYFDVSVSRHMLEEGDHAKALEWLDPDHALGELKNAVNAEFVNPGEFDKVGENIIKIKEAVDSGNTAEAHALIVPLQNMLAEKAYTTFAELDPSPERFIDSRYEASREEKVAEWKAKGYPDALIEKALKWGSEWSRGIAGRFIKEPELRAHVEQSLYPEALGLSEKWIEAMAK